MSKIVIALCLLAIVFFVAAQEAAAAQKPNLKQKLVEKIKAKIQDKIQKRGGAPFNKRPAVKLPLKEKIANLKEKLTKLKAKRDAIKQLKSRKPKSDKPRSRKPKSGKPSDKKVKSDKPRSRKPKSDKPRSRKPRSQKPKSRKPKAEKVSTKADAEFFKKLKKVFQKVAPIVQKGLQIYGKVKGMGILSESEFFDKIAAIKEKVNKYKKLLPAGLKDKLKQKIGDKIKSNPKFDKIRKVAKFAGDRKEIIKSIADKLKKRFAKKSTKTEADFGLIAGLLAKKAAGALLKKGLSKIASKKAKKSKKAETESDAEFFGKLKNWWDSKGKNLFEKAKNIYAKGKQVYDVVKGFKNE